MDRKELFDDYIFGKLSPRESELFERQMLDDEELATEFRLFLMTVDGIRKEEMQDCIEFGHAIKSLSKEQLMAIIGKKAIKMKVPVYRRYLWPITTAAVVVLAFTISIQLERHNRYSVDNLLYAYNEPVFSNRGGDEIDVSDCNDETLVELLPKIKSAYDASRTPQETLMNGKGLAMVYIKLHDRAKAKEILQELIEKYKTSEEYADAVEECRMIFNQIK